MNATKPTLPTITAVRTDSNPNMTDSGNMDHWKVTLRYGRRSMTLVYSMGHGLGGKEPTALDVLRCLVLDASGVVNRSFRDWCSDMGYDEDSRRAERIYNAIHDQTARLQRLLGSDWRAITDYVSQSDA